MSEPKSDDQEFDAAQEKPEAKASLLGADAGGGGSKTIVGTWFSDEGDPRNIVYRAQMEAKRLRQNHIGTDHMLIAFVAFPGDILGPIFQESGLTVEKLRAEVESLSGLGDPFLAAEIPFTPRARQVIEQAWNEARELGHNYLSGEHIFLAMTSMEKDVANAILETYCGDLPALYERVKRKMI